MRCHCTGKGPRPVVAALVYYVVVWCWRGLREFYVYKLCKETAGNGKMQGQVVEHGRELSSDNPHSPDLTLMLSTSSTLYVHFCIDQTCSVYCNGYFLLIQPI